MRANVPVHEGHLAEAVRQGVLAREQAEALLALHDAPGAADEPPPLRWIGGAQAALAAWLVLTPLAVLVMGDGAVGVPPAAFCAAGVLACAALARAAGALRWGRATASVFVAGVAPYAGALAACTLAPRALERLVTFDCDPGPSYDALCYAAGSAVAALVGIALWRWRRSGPSLLVAGAALWFAPSQAAEAGLLLTDVPDAAHALVPGVAGAAVFLASVWLERRQRAVDGALWLELASLPALALALVRCLAHRPDESPAWAALAALAAAASSLRPRPVPFAAATLAAIGAALYAGAWCALPYAAQVGLWVGLALAAGLATSRFRRAYLASLADRDAPRPETVW